MEIIFSQLVLKELQVPLFPVEFNNVIKVNSFSDDNDKAYNINLHKMSCTCMDFFSKDRNSYLLGDVRRLCKHLKYLITKKVNIDLLHPLCKWILTTGTSPGRNFHKLYIEQFKYTVFVAFDNKNEWWHIYMIDIKEEILHYSYHLMEKRFSYDDKPKGSVAVLKNHILELKKQLDYIEMVELVKQERQLANKRTKGCFIASLVIIILIYILIKVLS